MPIAMVPALEGAAAEALVARVCSEYDVRPSVAHQYTAEALAGFADARLRTFVPLLVEKQVRDRLRQLGRRRHRDAGPDDT